MTLTLRIEGSGAVPGGTDRITMMGEALTIGRAPGNDLVLPDPERVISSRHCVLEARGGDYLLIDISTNGTFVNYAAEAVGPAPIPINNGDVIGVGRYELRVEIAQAAPARDPYADLPPPVEVAPLVQPGRGQQDIFGLGGEITPPGASDADFLDDLLGDAPAGLARRTAHDPGPRPEDLLPPDIVGDPLAPDPHEPAPGASFANHGPGMQDHFAPPKVHSAPDLAPPAPLPPTPQPPAGQTGAPFGGNLLPDDWDDDLGSGPATEGVSPQYPPAAHPPAPPGPGPASDPFGAPAGPPNDPFAAPPSARQAAPEAMPPAGQPGIQPDPFAEPATAASSGVSSGAYSAAAAPAPTREGEGSPPPQAAQAWPGAAAGGAPPPSPSSSPPAPPTPADAQPAASPQPAAPSAQPTADRATDLAAARAFLRAAGMDENAVPDAELEEVMTRLGETFHILVGGLREVLISRAAIKNEFRLTQTVISIDGNNPLKFSVSAEHAVESMVKPATPGYQPAPVAAREAIDDIKAHEVAMMTGMQAAIDGLLKRFDPEKLSGRIERSGLSSLLSNRKARLWDNFEVLYGDIAREAEDDFQALFGREFARAYQAQLKKL
ncbi:MAG: type VI secretion system-associated FHA domain protein TagH [Pseudomonadota bacterium]